MFEEKTIEKEYQSFIKEAITQLKNQNYKQAYQDIMQAIILDPNSPEAQNLLGLWYEFKQDTSLARKHYRMAYVLDPVYKPASVNLERVSTLFPVKTIPADYGDVVEESELVTTRNLKIAK